MSMKKSTILVFKGDTYLEKHGEPLRMRRTTQHEEFQVEERLTEDPELVWTLDPRLFLSHAEVWLAAWRDLQAKHGEEFMREFWSNYASEDASKDRAQAMQRLDPLKGAEEVEFWARSLDARKQRGEQDGLADFYSDSLADWLRDCIISKDAAALRALASSLGEQKKAEKTGVFKNEKWKMRSLERMELKQRLLHCFCELLREHRAIPNNEELRRAAGIKPQQSDTNNVAKALREVGLGALPE